jgi:hypothetical protein
MREHPGQTLSNGGTPSQVIQATRSVDISEPARKGVRPNVRGNSVDHTGERITVSKNLAQKLADGDERMRAAAAKQRAAEEERTEETSVDKIVARLNFLERSNKKLTAELNKLKKEAS